MKRKDLIGLIVLGVVLVIVGSLLVGRFGNVEQRHSREIEIVQPISTEFNDQARQIILGRDKSEPIEPVPIGVDLESGFGNKSPFAE